MKEGEVERFVRFAENSFYSHLRSVLQPGSRSYQDILNSVYVDVAREEGISPSDAKYVLDHALGGIINRVLAEGGAVILPKPSRDHEDLPFRKRGISAELLKLHDGSYIAARLEDVRCGRKRNGVNLWNPVSGYISSPD